jgi:hypothetical protein
MVRSLSRLTGVPVLLIALFSANFSFAQDEPPEAERSRFDIGGRLHMLLGQNLVGVGTGVDVGYRFVPALSTGLFVHIAAGSHISGDYCLYEGKCFEGIFRFGAAVAVHPVQDYPLDPWLGVTAGPSYYDSGNPYNDISQKGYYSGWSFDFALDVGLDVRPAESFGLGVYLTILPPLTDHRPRWTAVGLHGSMSF